MASKLGRADFSDWWFWMGKQSVLLFLTEWRDLRMVGYLYCALHNVTKSRNIMKYCNLSIECSLFSLLLTTYPSNNVRIVSWTVSKNAFYLKNISWLKDQLKSLLHEWVTRTVSSYLGITYCNVVSVWVRWCVCVCVWLW